MKKTNYGAVDSSEGTAVLINCHGSGEQTRGEQKKISNFLFQSGRVCRDTTEREDKS